MNITFSNRFYLTKEAMATASAPGDTIAMKDDARNFITRQLFTDIY